MNKTYKYTLTAHGKKEISFDTGVARLAIANGDGVDGSTTVVMSEITKQHSGDIVSFLDGADAPFADFIVDIVAVQSGSGDPSPTNVRPISGWTGVNIYKRGFNLWDEEWEIGAINSTTGQPIDDSGRIRAQNYIPCLPNEQYYALDPTRDGNIMLFWYAHDYSYISKTTWIGNAVVTAPSNAYYLKFQMARSYDTTYNNDICINVSSSENGTYKPYDSNSETININWQDEAGTVYGGKLNVKTGVLTVTHANIASYDGETINEPWISSMDVYSAGATPTTGAQVVYPLATPVTYQLTPVEIRSLLGVNNVWADCGPVDVRYFVQSTQPMIDYIDDKTENVIEVIKATGHLGGTYTLDDMTCDELCTYARDHSNIVIKAPRGSSPLAYDIFILSDYIGTSAVFRNAIITTAVGGGKVLEIRELQADSGNNTNNLTTRQMGVNADYN